MYRIDKKNVSNNSKIDMNTWCIFGITLSMVNETHNRQTRKIYTRCIAIKTCEHTWKRCTWKQSPLIQGIDGQKQVVDVWKFQSCVCFQYIVEPRAITDVKGATNFIYQKRNSLLIKLKLKENCSFIFVEGGFLLLSDPLQRGVPWFCKI